MRFALSAVAASVLVAACVTATEDPTLTTEVETETLVEAEPVAAVESMTDSGSEDPLIWMEEVEGEAALNWVNTQNDRSLEAIQAHSVFEDNYAKALDLATSNDRIPYGRIRGGLVYNFWQDENNVRGLWRRTTLRRSLKVGLRRLKRSKVSLGSTMTRSWSEPIGAETAAR